MKQGEDKNKCFANLGLVKGSGKIWQKESSNVQLHVSYVTN